MNLVILKTMGRTNHWLNQQLDQVWQTFFSDVSRANLVTIRFGRKARTRLGSIRRRRTGTTVITISGYFQDETIPESVIHDTISHELIHYAHGFESPLPQLYRYPHEGRIIQSAMQQRGLQATHRRARHWLKTNWRNYLQNQGLISTVSRRHPVIRWYRRIRLAI